MAYPVIRDKQNFPAFTTASTGGSNPYTNVPVNSNGETIWNTEFLATKIFTFVATTHDLLVKILGSQDGGLTFNKTPLAETSVAVGAVVTEPIPTYYSALRVQVKAAVAGTNGTLTASAIGTSLPDTANISVEADVNTAEMEAKQDAANVLLGQLATVKYLGQARSTTTGATEALAIPTGSLKGRLFCGLDGSAYFQLNAAATTDSPHIEDPFQVAPIDLNGVTSLNVYCIAGKVTAWFFGAV